MTNQQILDNAPDGATHYGFSGTCNSMAYFQVENRETVTFYNFWREDKCNWYELHSSPDVSSLSDIKRIVELENELAKLKQI